jgi:hypothetical protein
MYVTTVLALLYFSLPALVTAQKDGTAYCDVAAKAPDKAACADIKSKGPKPSSYYTDDEWWSGNCRVALYNGISSSTDLSGTEVQTAIQNILDTCDVGFQYVKGVRVEVDVCTVGQSGVVSECRGPFQHVKGFGDKRDTSMSARHHLTDVKRTKNPNHVFSRDEEPFPGVICAPSGASKISDCGALSDEILSENGDSLTLPYKKYGTGCEVQVWPTTRDTKRARTDHVTYTIKEDADVCADPTKTYIGFVANYNGLVNGGEFHTFFGTFCGRLGSGNPGSCTPGGKN